jgi:pimeloyl-ACP methyl ester carboxylesterase
MPVLHVEARVPSSRDDRPPLLLVHGAGNSAWVWQHWLGEFARFGWSAYALALRGHRGSEPVDLGRVGMADYVGDVRQVAGELRRPPIVFGWSMGGLVAQQFAAAEARTPAAVLLAPSPPLAVQGPGAPAEVAAIPDVFRPEAYGIGPDVASSRRAMPELTDAEAEQVVRLVELESGRARRERKAGIDVPGEALHCPVLVVAGGADRQFPPAVCRRVAEHYGGELLEVPGAGHWGLVMSERAVRQMAPRVSDWLDAQVGGRSSASREFRMADR